MGVEGFLRQVKDALEEAHLRKFSGETIVVDAFSWLHKACYGCAFELATGKETDSYVWYMLRKVDLMRSCGVKEVILVFDGQRLPLKASTHEKRQGSKEENRRIAMQLMRDSRCLDDEARKAKVAKAYQCFQRTVSITQTIVTNVMNALRAGNIPFVVAPFEADAQMVWMCKTGIASAIVTEDSDVFLYCITCGVDTPVLFKLDDSGFVQTLSRPSLRKHSEKSSNPFMKKLFNLTTGDKEATRMFVQFCVLSGCDFLDSLPNMGIVTALKQVFNFRGAPGHLRVQRILSKLSSSGVKIPLNFIERFVQAESIFFHHVIFNPSKQVCEFLIDDSHSNCHADIFKRVLDSLGITAKEGGEIDVDGEAVNLHTGATLKSSFLGVMLVPEVVNGIYNGSICPRTLRSLTEPHNDADEFRPYSPQTKSNHEHDEPAEYGADALDDSKTNDEDEEISSLLRASPGPTTCSQRVQQKAKTKPPSPEMLERKRNVQARQRSSTFKSLLSVYAKADSEEQLDSSSKSGELASTPPVSAKVAGAAHTGPKGSSWLLDRVSAAPSETRASRKRTLDETEGASHHQPTGSKKSTTTSFHDLMNKNRASFELAPLASTPLKASAQHSSTAKSFLSMSDPPAKKQQQRNAATPASKKPNSKSASASKAKPSPRGTLLSFFQKI